MFNDFVDSLRGDFMTELLHGDGDDVPLTFRPFLDSANLRLNGIAITLGFRREAAIGSFISWTALRVIATIPPSTAIS